MLWRPLLFSRGPKAQGKIVAVSRALRGAIDLTIPRILSSQYLFYTMISPGFFSCHVIVKTNTWLKSLQSWYNIKYSHQPWLMRFLIGRSCPCRFPFYLQLLLCSCSPLCVAITGVPLPWVVLINILWVCWSLHFLYQSLSCRCRSKTCFPFLRVFLCNIITSTHSRYNAMF